MAIIARWTTPTVIYKPSAVDATTISEIFFVISHNDRPIIKKGIQDAELYDGKFTWRLSQKETSRLVSGTNVFIKVDYLCHNGMRYTTNPRKFTVSESAINGVI